MKGWLILCVALGALGAEARPASSAVPTLYDSLLQKYVRDGLVAYRQLAQDPRLDRCVRQFARARPESLATASERLGFWIDAYNLTVIASVIRHGIPDKVTDVPGFFSDEKHEVAGRALTLDEMENGIIRPFGDARVHAALVCAAMSCPALPSRAYGGKNLDARLGLASRRFLADSSRNRVNPAKGVLRLSKVFEWYGEDFVREYGSVVGFVKRYGPAPASAWDDAGPIAPRYIDYDWTLNKQ